MPLQHLKDAKGDFLRFGQSGTKYYFNPSDSSSVQEAYQKVTRQQRAIEMSKARRQNGFEPRV